MENLTETEQYSRKILKVHELTGAIRQLLETQFSDLWIEGEVSDLRTPRSGHLYFTLKDAGATLKTVIFKSHVRFLRFLPKAGTHVLIRGHLSLYEPRGEYQLICNYIEPRGAGALQAVFEALKEKLRLEGLFDQNRKQAMPMLPSRVGIITSETGAAIQDIIKIIRQEDCRCHILLHPVAVQGPSAGTQIAAALDAFNVYANNTALEIDLLILTRGGGSLEDLWAFNEEVVARAIARSKIPVISAIGHESDTSISDYVADLRVPTPSAAAQRVVQLGKDAEKTHQNLKERLIKEINALRAEKKQRVDIALRLLGPPSAQTTLLRDECMHLLIRLRQSIQHHLDKRQHRTQQAQQGLQHLNPVKRIRLLQEQYRQSQNRLTRAGRRFIQVKKQHFQAALGQLDLVSPLNILSRGYSITQKEPVLSVIRDASEVSVGDRIKIKLHRGSLNCKVEGKQNPEERVFRE